MGARWKKEEARKRAEAREGLTPDQIAGLDQREALEQAIEARAREIRAILFPEDYDFMFDNSAEAKLRSQGISPMSEDYIKEVNERRLVLGVAPISGPVDPNLLSSWDYCLKLARDQLSSPSGE